jgi:hypothetical protein
MSEDNKSFWSTLPGLLTAVAALVTAGTGAFLALRASNPSSGAPPASQQASPQESASTQVPESVSPERFTGPMGALEQGVSYSGGDIYDRPASSAEQCATLCGNDDRCRAVTFIISQQRCWLKGSINPAQYSNDMISARKRD